VNATLILLWKIRSLPLLGAWMGLLALHSALAQDFHITALSFDGANRVRLHFPGDTNSYFVLYRGDAITNVITPIVLKFGADADGALTDIEPFNRQNPARFFRVRKVLLTTPADVDGDGIDDLYEFTRSAILDPLDTADGEEDPDADDLTNVEEYNFGSDPSAADLDGDGWIDGIEKGDGTDPNNPASRPQHSLLSRPPTLAELPSPVAAGASGSGLVLARPPLALDVPSADASGTTGAGLLLAMPPVLMDLLSPDVAGSAGGGVFLAQPPLAIDVPSPDAAGSSGATAILAFPPLSVEVPSADVAGVSGNAVSMAAPPVNIKLNSQ
jgi:hypothetical protein